MILAVNAGSSSLRLAAFAGDPAGPRRVAVATWARGDAPPGELLHRFQQERRLPPPEVVVHRIVHGGHEFIEPCRIDARVEAGIARLIPLAPLHNPAALELIEACRGLPGEPTQVAVFDTAFFHDLPDQARNYALPAELTARHGLRRYGFHGLAHQALWQAWRDLQEPGGPRPARIISLQLGSGCSISAIRDGKPLDTSMGFTPLEGLVMATRSGDLDPGLLLFLAREPGLDAAALEDMLSQHSGLLGLAGLGGDMRQLLASDAAAARQAIGLYCYRAAKYIGAYLTVLGGAEAIVFGGGVGENAPSIRAGILENLHWAGIHLDPAANRAAIGRQQCISRASSPVSVWVLPVDEATLMAEQAQALLAGG
jgi:acetate kinase